MTDGMRQETPAGGRRMQRRSLDTRRRLIEAAIAAFAESGYAGAATRDIAERAGVNHPLITYHFRNKHRLWQAAADRLFGELGDELGRALVRCNDHPPAERLRAAIDTITRYSARRPEWQHFVRDATAAGGERSAWLAETHLSRLFATLTPVLETAQLRTPDEQSDPAQLCLALLAASGGIFTLAPAYERVTGRSLRDAGGADVCARLLNRLFVTEPRP